MLISVLTSLALLQAPDSAAPPAPRDTLRLFAVGDINLGRAIAYNHLLRGDTLYPFRGLLDTLRRADILFGNLESPIAPPGHTLERTGSPVFSAPPVAADALVQGGFDVVSTANNHAWDAGLRGVLETLTQLDRVGLPHAGTGRTLTEAHRPALIERNGWRVAVFALTRAYNPAPRTFYSHAGSRYIAYADSGWLYPAIRRVKERGDADLVIVSLHAGEELSAGPDSALARLLRGAVDAGADICLGHHPHVLQPVEWYRGKPIAYSLGNFVFGQGAPWARLSAIFRFTIAPDGTTGLDAVPVRVSFQPRVATGTAADSVWRRLGSLNPVDPAAAPARQ